jgi:hypothetical protein
VADAHPRARPGGPTRSLSLPYQLPHRLSPTTRKWLTGLTPPATATAQCCCVAYERSPHPFVRRGCRNRANVIAARRRTVYEGFHQ